MTDILSRDALNTVSNKNSASTEFATLWFFDPLSRYNKRLKGYWNEWRWRGYFHMVAVERAAASTEPNYELGVLDYVCVALEKNRLGIHALAATNVQTRNEIPQPGMDFSFSCNGRDESAHVYARIENDQFIVNLTNVAKDLQRTAKILLLDPRIAEKLMGKDACENPKNIGAAFVTLLDEHDNAALERQHDIDRLLACVPDLEGSIERGSGELRVDLPPNATLPPRAYLVVVLDVPVPSVLGTLDLFVEHLGADAGRKSILQEVVRDTLRYADVRAGFQAKRSDKGIDHQDVREFINNAGRERINLSSAQDWLKNATRQGFFAPWDTSALPTQGGEPMRTRGAPSMSGPEVKPAGPARPVRGTMDDSAKAYVPKHSLWEAFTARLREVQGDTAPLLQKMQDLAAQYSPETLQAQLAQWLNSLQPTTANP